MKAVLALSLTVAVFAPLAPASADHLCVTSSGRPLVCTPHPEEWISREEICVTSGGSPVVCV